ncbi:arginase [Elysia marginata]|uniref:Arginase n=1 Tax=Elysia marginata TaxID=1093978 RepID=A0AAV4IWQ4_9GAST|nr:arginase [Elysia marginata]
MAGQPVGVLGFPFSKGQPKGGTEIAPAALREAGIIDAIHKLGNSVVDHGDVELASLPEESQENTAKNCYAVGAANKKVSRPSLHIASARP